MATHIPQMSTCPLVSPPHYDQSMGCMVLLQRSCCWQLIVKGEMDASLIYSEGELHMTGIVLTKTCVVKDCKPELCYSSVKFRSMSKPYLKPWI